MYKNKFASVDLLICGLTLAFFYSTPLKDVIDVKCRDIIPTVLLHREWR